MNTVFKFLNQLSKGDSEQIFGVRGSNFAGKHKKIWGSMMEGCYKVDKEVNTLTIKSFRYLHGCNECKTGEMRPDEGSIVLIAYKYEWIVSCRFYAHTHTDTPRVGPTWVQILSTAEQLDHNQSQLLIFLLELIDRWVPGLGWDVHVNTHRSKDRNIFKVKRQSNISAKLFLLKIQTVITVKSWHHLYPVTKCPC